MGYTPDHFAPVQMTLTIPVTINTAKRHRPILGAHVRPARLVQVLSLALNLVRRDHLVLSLALNQARLPRVQLARAIYRQCRLSPPIPVPLTGA